MNKGLVLLFLSLPRMRHGDFVAYGTLERFVPKMFGESPGDTKSGFEWLCRYSLHFLNAYMNGDATGSSFLRHTPAANGVPASLVDVSVLSASAATAGAGG